MPGPDSVYKRERTATERKQGGIPANSRAEAECGPCCSFTIVDCRCSIEVDEEISYDVAVPRRNGATVETLENADAVVVVGGADPLGLGRLIRALHELMTVVPGVSPYVVLNRVRPTLGWSEGEIVDTVRRVSGVATIHALPEDRSACDKALVHGRTLSECAPDAKLTKALGAMAAEIAGVPEPAGKRLRSRTAARAR